MRACFGFCDLENVLELPGPLPLPPAAEPAKDEDVLLELKIPSLKLTENWTPGIPEIPIGNQHFYGLCLFQGGTLQGTNISPKNCILKMIFLFPRWDMLIPWRVDILIYINMYLNPPRVSGARRIIIVHQQLLYVGDHDMFARAFDSSTSTPKNNMILHWLFGSFDTLVANHFGLLPSQDIQTEVYQSCDTENQQKSKICSWKWWKIHVPILIFLPAYVITHKDPWKVYIYHYLPTWMDELYGFHVGKYTSPMDPMEWLLIVYLMRVCMVPTSHKRRCNPYK